MKGEVAYVLNKKNGGGGGSGGGAAFTFKQDIPASKWEITHSLGNQFPDVRCVDFDGNRIYGDVKFISVNMLSIEFCQAVSGKAFIQ